MRSDGKEDLRVRRTLENIRRSFEALMLEKDYEKITVTELASRAMINKKTFYTYYPSLNDLLSEVQEELSAEFAERTKNYTYRDIDQLTREFFLFSEEKGPYYEKITCTDSIIRNRMIRKVYQTADRGYRELDQFTLAEQNLIRTFVSRTTLSIYKQWIEDGKTVPLEKVIEMTSTMITGGMNEIIRRK